MGILDKYRKAEEEKLAAPKQGWGEYLDDSVRDTAVKFADTISFGGLTALADQLNTILPAGKFPGAPEEDLSATARVARADERSPIASMAGTAAGYVAPVGGAAAGITRLGSHMLPGMMPFMRGFLGQGAIQGGASGITATVDELARQGLSEGEDPFNLMRVMRETALGGAIGAATRGLTSAFGSKNAVGSRIENLKPGEKLPTAAKDPTGLLDPGVPVTGPEALKLSGRPGTAREAASLLEEVRPRAQATIEDSAALKAASGRGDRLTAAERRLADRADEAAQAAAAARPAPDARLTGINRQMTPGGRDVPGAKELPGSRESLANVEARLARLREDQVLQPTIERAGDIAAIEKALGRKLPADAAAAEAQGALSGFQGWRDALPVEPFPVPKAPPGLLGKAMNAVAGSPKLALMGQAAGALASGRAPILNPKGVADTILDPAKLSEALSPEDLILLLIRSGLIGSTAATGAGFVNSKTGGRNRPIVD